MKSRADAVTGGCSDWRECAENPTPLLALSEIRHSRLATRDSEGGCEIKLGNGWGVEAV